MGTSEWIAVGSMAVAVAALFYSYRKDKIKDREDLVRHMENVTTRLDSIDSRLDSMDDRLVKLESKRGIFTR